MRKRKANVITIAEIKGGTGKTTTAAALAQAAALDNKKVLLIDLDAQANLTTLSGADPTKPGAWNLLEGFSADELIQQTYFDNIEIIAGAPNLAAEIPQKGSLYRLEAAIMPLLDSYNLILIDTPPAFGEMTYNALQASNGLLIALETNTSALQGFYYISDLAKAAKRTNPKLKLYGAILTRYNPRPVINRQMRDIITEKANGIKCPLIGEIREGVAIREAQAYGKNIFTYAPKSKPAIDYKSLYTYLISNKFI